MRKQCAWYRDGDMRIKTKFLLFPNKIKYNDGSCECRWLEKAQILQYFSVGVFRTGWCDISYVPDGEFTDMVIRSEDKEIYKRIRRYFGKKVFILEDEN